MKKLFLIVFLFSVKYSFAQPVRLHILGGLANYNGDLQEKRFSLGQANIVVGAGGTYNISNHIALRSEYSFTHLEADDKRSTNPFLIARNLNFKTIIEEFDIMGQYDILDLNKHPLSPYVFAGVGIFHFNPYTYNSKGNKIYLAGLHTEGQGFTPKRDIYKTTQLNIPVGGGLKYALSEDIHIGFEIGLRVLKTDYLDDVSSTYIDKNALLRYKGQQAVDLAFRGDELKNNPQTYPRAGTPRGNGKVNDFYYYTQFMISFRMPWFEKMNNESYKSDRSKLYCPIKL